MSIDVTQAQEISSRIPADFTLGVATSSWQIEGSSHSRGRSIWDDFAQTPGKILDGATADPACDHLNNIPGDLDLIQGLGANAYRFSLAWPRVMHEGVGRFPQQGLMSMTGLSMAR